MHEKHLKSLKHYNDKIKITQKIYTSFNVSFIGRSKHLNQNFTTKYNSIYRYCIAIKYRKVRFNSCSKMHAALDIYHPEYTHYTVFNLCFEKNQDCEHI